MRKSVLVFTFMIVQFFSFSQSFGRPPLMVKTIISIKDKGFRLGATIQYHGCMLDEGGENEWVSIPVVIWATGPGLLYDFSMKRWEFFWNTDATPIFLFYLVSVGASVVIASDGDFGFGSHLGLTFMNYCDIGIGYDAMRKGGKGSGMNFFADMDWIGLRNLIGLIN